MTVLGFVKQQLSNKLGLRQSRYGILGSPRQFGHRRQASISTFNARKITWLVCAGLFFFTIFLVTSSGRASRLLEWHSTNPPDGKAFVTFGKSVERYGREFFWWEQFPILNGYFHGRKMIVPTEEYVPEQSQHEPTPGSSGRLELVNQKSPFTNGLESCEIEGMQLAAYSGVPQGMPNQLLGSNEEIGINMNKCYDRVARLGPYGLTILKEYASAGDFETPQKFEVDMENMNWQAEQKSCLKKNSDALAKLPRTAFVLRTWHAYKYTSHQILMLRALINELSLRSGGQIYVHFLIHVQDDMLPIWASDEIYNATLKASLPAEFEGMGTLWSVAQMKLIYPPPFPKSLINFSGGDLYQAYRSLHFPLQHFAAKHPEFDYFWQWEMDIRVTGDYGELINKITDWADEQQRDHLWERSAQFFIPELHNNSYTTYSQAIKAQTAASRQKPIAGPQIPILRLLSIPHQKPPAENTEITDLITFSPLFDPSHTQWAFRDDITGYDSRERPPTRAALIAASRMSRRLLLLMHEETFKNNHTMFPEMYPASIALHYGLKAVYAPISIYLDRNWPAEHADEIFNNAKLRTESFPMGMDHGAGHFHGPGGSVFGPGEHVFRGASWYSNALFAEVLWKRWLGTENTNDELEYEMGEGNGRMCLPMMVLHPVKHD